MMPLTYFHLILTISAMAHVCSAHLSQETMISDNQNSGTAVLPTTKSTETTETTTTGTLLDTFFGHDTRESEGGRTFGRIKKLQASLLPVMFKLGVFASIIVAILLLSIKSVFIGMTLLLINFAFIVAKLVSLKHGSGGGHQESWSSGGGPSNGVHVHIHNPAPEKYYSHPPVHDIPYGSYSKSSNVYAVGPSGSNDWTSARNADFRSPELNVVLPQRYGEQPKLNYRFARTM